MSLSARPLEKPPPLSALQERAKQQYLMRSPGFTPIARARLRSPVLPIRKLIPVPCGPASRWCRKTAYCLMKPLGKTSPLMRAIRTHRNSMRWSQRPMWAISCKVWPKVWIPKSGRAAQTYLAGSVNGSPSPARSCAIRRYCFWMKPPQHWTPNQRSWCKML